MMIWSKKNIVTKIGLLTINILFLAHGFALAYDFGEARKSLEQDLTAKQFDLNSITLAIVYDNRNRELIKETVNLIQLKKDIAYEFTKGFRVTDPLVTQDILDLNQLDSLKLKQDTQVLKQFADRAGASHILFIAYALEGNEMAIEFELREQSGYIVSVSKQIVAKETKETNEIAPDETITESSPKPTIGETSFFPRNSYLNPSHNETWFPFSPTAFLVPKHNALESSVWVKNPSENEVYAMNLRYDFRYSRFQMGIQLNGTEENKLHSAYSLVRLLAIDETMLPFNVVLGIRYRVYWDKENLDFVNEDEELENKNTKLNQFSYILAISGKSRYLGMIGNLYWDNQKVTAGVKILVTPSIQLLLEGKYYHYEEPNVKSDVIVGVELFAQEMFSISVAYQGHTEYGLLGVKFDW